MPLTRLFTYDAWANAEALRSLRAMPAPPPFALGWLAHIVGAQEVWWGRLQDPVVPAEIWPQLTITECALRLDEMAGRWRALFATVGPGGLERPLDYANSRGERFSTPLGDVLMHVVMHGVYHRGQIATAVRAAGGVPAVTDYIHAVRMGELE
ncbi:MAG TPA: DinB family protein [Gemmatimonadaceae bacterium]|nr:DinB family protein [Gemmatimonadaceae bacterium]